MENDLYRKAIEASRFDPLSTAERFVKVGIISPDAKDEVAMAMLHENSGLRRRLWGELGDTFRGMSWEEFTRITNAEGFQPLKEWKFPYKYDTDLEPFYPRKLISADVDRKMLLIADSWTDDTSPEIVNEIEVIAYVEAEDSVVSEIRDKVHAMSRYKDGAWEFVIHGEEGLFTQLNAFKREGVKHIDWKDIPIVINDYSNINEKSEGKPFSMKAYKQREKERLAQVAEFLLEVPPEVRAFIDLQGRLS